ncbi:hypothetical protein [Natrialba sp. PRR66]|uniref:hypothetical protein n=1 Tax=Natrialba sp. PRR66 TaxID=3098146 RepID=UPI002B1D2C16|nr:hypothetical protein [Natrialba sp. PRR66]
MRDGRPRDRRRRLLANDLRHRERPWIGDIGTPTGDGIDFTAAPELADYRAVYGLLEHYRVTGRTAYRNAAARVGENARETRLSGNVFVDEEGRVRLEDPVRFR